MSTSDIKSVFSAPAAAGKPCNTSESCQRTVGQNERLLYILSRHKVTDLQVICRCFIALRLLD